MSNDDHNLLDAWSAVRLSGGSVVDATTGHTDIDRRTTSTDEGETDMGAAGAGTKRSPGGYCRLADPERGVLDDIVDTARFGLDERAGSWDRLGAAMARQLHTDGVAQVPGFLRPAAVDAIAAELDRALPFIPVVHDRRSVYGRTDAAAGELGATSDWIAGHATRDMFPPQSPAHRLYVSPLFKRLIGACVGADRLFEYADPLAGLVATVLPPGGCYGWHYDTNEYVVTVAIREAEQGGAFEFHRDLRGVGDENLDGLRRVVDADDTAGRRSIGAQPGDLQVFRGRYSLHRVTEIGGDATRLTLVLSYARRPGLIGPAERTRRVYGRVTEAHLVASQVEHGHDGLIW